jgi:hypothetical protein
MDKWTPEQLTKLRNGGNAAFNEFVISYPSSNNGGYPAASELKKIINNAEGTQGGGAGGMSAGGASAGVEKGRVMREKYGCWAVKEYREKVSFSGQSIADLLSRHARRGRRVELDLWEGGMGCLQ